jgi:hypothetical protein
MYVPTGKDIKGSAEKREIRRKKSLSPRGLRSFGLESGKNINKY